MPFTRKVQMDDPNFRIQFLTQAPSTTDLCQTTGASKCRKMCDTHTHTHRCGAKRLDGDFCHVISTFSIIFYHFPSFSIIFSFHLILSLSQISISTYLRHGCIGRIGSASWDGFQWAERRGAHGNRPWENLGRQRAPSWPRKMGL